MNAISFPAILRTLCVLPLLGALAHAEAPLSSLLKKSFKQPLGATAGLSSSVFHEKRSTAGQAGSGTLLLQQAVSELTIQPSSFVLRGKSALQQLLVSGNRSRRVVDLTREVEFQSATPEIVQVSRTGVVTSVSNGRGVIIARSGNLSVETTVEVVDSRKQLPVSFQLDILPILAARGCSTGQCHGKARGQNGFQLSLLSFDSDFDFAALTKNARGRRVFPAAPDRSLLLLKGAAVIPHGGGQRIKPQGNNYNTLRRWITSGMLRRIPQEPTLLRITISPSERFMQSGEQQQLLATAHYSDDTRRDVTAQTMFQSNESAIVSVDSDGLVKAGPIPGQATMMARYMGSIATCSVLIPLPGEVPDQLYANLPRYNFIDDLVWKKLQSLRITPSEPADDAKFLRRVYIDIIGCIAAPAEAKSFLSDTDPLKRERLVDTLLERHEYADHWAGKWADLLRPNPYRVGIKAVLNYDNWIRESFRKNKPYDQFVRDLVAAQGSTWHNGAATLFRDRRSPEEITTLVSQLFLGIRLECAKCHHHPFEKWEQADFFSFAAYFSRVGRKGAGLSPPISGGEEIVFTAKTGSVKHPITGQTLPPKPLFGQAPEIQPDEDPRTALAAWITSDDNQYFSRVLVNRVWADLMGRGLVEPIDDLRATNPPTNEPLLDALAKEFRRQRYDLKSLIRTITTSYVYGLSSEANQRNIADTRNYSRHYRQRLRAEVLADAISDITDIPDKFSAMPIKSRASQIWTRRVNSLFLDTFGRPDPNQDPPCRRTSDTAVTQTLHLMNAPALHGKITSSSGRAAQLAESDQSVEEIVKELYFWVYSRPPREKERLVGENLLIKSGSSRREATEDLLWALLNTPEFIFKD